MLRPFEWAYGALVHARNTRFDRATPQRLGWPVVSIGNLSVGGAGKTPLVIALARLLQREGLHPDVLSRGYGRSAKTVELVAPGGDAQRFGDEPLLIARAAGVPVYVGARRYAAGRLAESQARHAGIHLLDDGFQHRQLARDVDIVVMHRSDLREHLLPLGRLREPLSGLRRAGVIVLRHEDGDLEPLLRAHTHNDCLFWRLRRFVTSPASARRAVAFCAIAHPAEFFAGLSAAGIEMAEQISFRDHHRYTLADMDRLALLGKRHACDAFIITGKDEVKLNPAMRFRLNAVAPLCTATLTVEIEDEQAVLRQLRGRLRL